MELSRKKSYTAMYGYKSKTISHTIKRRVLTDHCTSFRRYVQFTSLESLWRTHFWTCISDVIVIKDTDSHAAHLSGFATSRQERLRHLLGYWRRQIPVRHFIVTTMVFSHSVDCVLKLIMDDILCSMINIEKLCFDVRFRSCVNVFLGTYLKDNVKDPQFFFFDANTSGKFFWKLFDISRIS